MRALLLTLLLTACWRDPPAGPLPARMPTEIDESSGLARTGRFGTLWTHGDSGTAPVLFEISTTGRLVHRVRVEGASNVDWEDVAPDGLGGLWIADTGNNANNRRNLALHHIPAVALVGQGPARADRTIRVRYPEQTGFPMPARRNFDAEALFVDGDTLWLLTKHRSDTSTVLYRVPVQPSDGPVDLVKTATFDVGGADHPYGGMVTSADLHPSGRWLAVLTYHAVLLFERPEDPQASWLSRPVGRVVLRSPPVGQTEAISWDGSGLILTNEAGRMFRLDDPLAAERVFPGR